MDLTAAERLSSAIEGLLDRLHGGCQAELFDALLDLDLSFTQARVVFALAKHGAALQINELAEHLGVSVATAGRNVEQVMGLGLVHRREDTEDRRIKLVTLSEKGRKTALVYESAMRAQIQTFVQIVPGEEAALLADALNNALAGADLLAADSQDFAR